MSKKGFTLWFTGLSGAGKSTLAEFLTPQLRERGVPVEVLDGDEVRENLSKGLGFSKEDRDTNIRRIGYVANMLSRNGVCAITAAISPYQGLRDEIRAKTETFVEVYVEAPLAVVEERDTKASTRRPAPVRSRTSPASATPTRRPPTPRSRSTPATSRSRSRPSRSSRSSRARA